MLLCLANPSTFEAEAERFKKKNRAAWATDEALSQSNNYTKKKKWHMFTVYTCVKVCILPIPPIHLSSLNVFGDRPLNDNNQD